MRAIWSKEISLFFSSVTGYISIAVFLIASAAVLFFFPETSVLDFGYATLDPFFDFAPYIFLFLIPAITMRSFAEEKANQTLELLRSKPLRYAEIIFGKYVAVVTIIIIALLPTIIYAYAVSNLAEPVGNIDQGGIIGSYIGLLFLASCFAAIGLFASSLANNQVIAFVFALFLCFSMYYAFTSISQIPWFVGKFDYIIQQFGLETHYAAMSNGVIRSKDEIYFLSVIAMFLWLAYVSLNRKKTFVLYTTVFLVGLILINRLTSNFNLQYDFTEEKRYTLNSSTRQLLKTLNEPVEVIVLLKQDEGGDALPASFKRLQQETKDILKSFRSISGKSMTFSFENPLEGLSTEEKNQQLFDLQSRGVQPTNVRIKTKSGFKENLIFPAAFVVYKGKQFPVSLLSGQRGQNDINRSIELLEYKFANAISKLKFEQIPQIAFTQGHGELEPIETQDIQTQLAFNYYQPLALDLAQVDRISQDVNLLFIAKPEQPFSEQDKFKIDQYVMNGGKVIWAIDMMKMNLDSLRTTWGGRNVAVDFNLNLDDQLFKYGARIQRNFVRDMQSKPIPIVIDENGQTQLLPWTFFPVISGKDEHITTKNITPVSVEFASSIEIVGNDAIQKQVLLSSSENAGLVANPVLVDLEELRNPPPSSAFALQNIPVAVLLEGQFPSLYKFRSSPLDSISFQRKDESVQTKMAIIADGDIARNEVMPNGQILPLGYDRALGEQFGNREFLLNLIDYMVNDDHTLEARNKQVKLRLLNQTKVNEQRRKWQLQTTLFPLIFIGLISLGFYGLRRLRFG